MDLRAPARVRTPRFVFALRQGRAIFAADSARVVEGEVQIYSLDEKLLATVAAGERWSAPAPKAAPAPSPASLLDKARAALAAGDVLGGRKLVARALESSPSVRERAQAELFLADAFLVEADADRAVAAYRKVADAWPRLPEGDSAAFAAAQVLSEGGRSDEASAALRAYLAQHPDGRFAREARERLDARP
jgi:tetratricopeptide (TPR) repeat protein